MNSSFEFTSTPDGPAVADASPALLRQLLSELDSQLLSMGIPVADWLNPGIGGEQISSQLRAVGLYPSEELLVWFGWCNGRVRDPKTRGAIGRPLPEFDISSLGEAVEFYRTLSNKQFDFGAGPGWLMLVNSNWGLAVDCSRPGIVSPRIHSTIAEFTLPENDNSFRAVSLCTFVAWWLVGIAKGGWAWDPADASWSRHNALLPDSQRRAAFF